MADRIEMARFYHQYQDAAIKCTRAKQELDKIEKLLQTMPDPDTPADPTAQLVQLCQSKPVSVKDHHDRRVRDINPDFNDRR